LVTTKSQKRSLKEYWWKNRDILLVKSKIYYQNNKEKIKKRSKEDYERTKEHRYVQKREYFKTAEGIYAYLCGRLKKIEKGLELLKISKEDFIKWFNQQEQKCFYCGRTLEEIQNDKTQVRKIIRRFQVDRIDNNKGYEIGNIVLACSRCNSIKSDFFTKDEMLKICEIFAYKFI
jgi:5-methylcytosine-specific restriction endonuclease McrA